MISNVEKTTATGQGTPALTPLTIVAREVTNQRIKRFFPDNILKASTNIQQSTFQTARHSAQGNTSLSVALMAVHITINVNWKK